MNKYQAFYKGKNVEVEAETPYKAQCKAAELLKAKKAHQVAVVLLPKEGEEVLHSNVAQLW